MAESTLIAPSTLSLQASKPMPTIGKNLTDENIRQTAREFEAFYLGQVLQPMFESINPEPPFGGGHAEKIWQSMMVDEMGKAMATAGGIGIADSIQREILRLQEVQA